MEPPKNACCSTLNFAAFSGKFVVTLSTRIWVSRMILSPPSGFRRRSLCRNVQRFREGLVFKAHIIVYHSTLEFRVIKRKRRNAGLCPGEELGLEQITQIDRLRFGWDSERGTARANDAQGTPTQIHVSPSMLVYEEYVYLRAKLVFARDTRLKSKHSRHSNILLYVYFE